MHGSQAVEKRVAQQADAGSGERQSPARLESVLDFRVLPVAAETGETDLGHQIVGVLPPRRHQLSVNLDRIRPAAERAFLMDQSHARTTQHQADGIMRRSANPPEPAAAMLTHVVAAAHLQSVALGQPARRRQRTRQVLDESKAELQDFKSPFFRSIP